MANFDVELNDEVENFTVEFGEIQRITVDDFDKLRNRPSYAGQTMTHETNIPEVPTAVSQLTNDADYQTGSEVESAISTAVGDEKDAREQADAELSRDIGVVDGKVDAEADARERADIALQGAIDDEETARKNADNGLQGQIDAITSSSDVVDIVGTYAELLQYPTAGLGDKDVIKVLQDETHNDAMSYYRWNKSSSTWSYIGSEGPYYTKSETNTLLGDKQDTLTAGSNVTIQGNTISATDTTYTAGNGLTLTGTEFSADTTVLQPKLTAGDSINISPQNVISADIDPADFFTASETVDGTGSEITLNNTIQAKIKSVQMDGDTFQKSYSGKNLLKLSGKTSAGVTGTVNADGSYTISGTGTVTDGVSVFLFGGVLPAGTYTLSLSKALPSVINLSFEGGVALRIRAGSTSATITTTKEYTSASVFFAITTGVSYDETFNMQVTAGNTPDYDFEPYVGGIPAPSPDYPQTIQTVTGEQTVEVTGKNLYEGSQDFSGTWANSTSWTTDTETYNGLVVKYKSDAWNGLYKEIEVEAGKTYTFSSYIKAGSTRNVDIYLSGGSATFSPRSKSISITTEWQRYSITFAVSNSGTVRARIENTSNQTTPTYVCGYQLEESGSMTVYEPHQSQSYEINLGKNLIYNHATDKSQSGVDMTMNADGTVTANGNGTGTAFFLLQTQQESEGFAPGTYTIKCHSTLAYGKIIVEGYASSDLSTKIIDVRPEIGITEATFTLIAPDTRLRLSVVVLDSSKAPHNFDNEIIGPFQLEVGSATSYAPYFTPIELCKIGDYRDEIFKNDPNEDWYDPDLEDNAWYVHKEVGHLSLPIANMNNSESYPGWKNQAQLQEDLGSPTYGSLSTGTSYFTNMSVFTEKGASGDTAVGLAGNGSTLHLRKTYFGDDFSQTYWKTNYPNSIFELYYQIIVPVADTKITDATLISELDALADTLGYKDKTIITVSATGTNLPAILEVSAYRNSLAGVLGVIGRAEAA